MQAEKLGKDRMFERIRRITGYLVGTMDKWNNAKKAEEKDRVVHSVRKEVGDEDS
jgi:ribonucleoside-triphosphate reductase